MLYLTEIMLEFSFDLLLGIITYWFGVRHGRWQTWVALRPIFFDLLRIARHGDQQITDGEAALAVFTPRGPMR